MFESSSRILFIDTKAGTAQFQTVVLWYKFKWKETLLCEECGDDGKLRK
jgi:hypothetical protein